MPKAGDYKPWTCWVFHSVQEVHFTIPSGEETLFHNIWSTEHTRNMNTNMCVLFQNESPGPGSYDCTTSTELQSPSFSKKGTTGFVPSKVSWALQLIPDHQCLKTSSKAPIQLWHYVLKYLVYYSGLKKNISSCHDSFCFSSGIFSSMSLYWQAPRASSYPKRGIPAPNVYNLQRSFTDKCDFSVGASRVFRLPVGVQLDSPKHVTPAPNHYNVCRLKWLF